MTAEGIVTDTAVMAFEQDKGHGFWDIEPKPQTWEEYECFWIHPD